MRAARAIIRAGLGLLTLAGTSRGNAPRLPFAPDSAPTAAAAPTATPAPESSCPKWVLDNKPSEQPIDSKTKLEPKSGEALIDEYVSMRDFLKAYYDTEHDPLFWEALDAANGGREEDIRNIFELVGQSESGVMPGSGVSNNIATLIDDVPGTNGSKRRVEVSLTETATRTPGRPTPASQFLLFHFNRSFEFSCGTLNTSLDLAATREAASKMTGVSEWKDRIGTPASVYREFSEEGGVAVIQEFRGDGTGDLRRSFAVPE